MAICVLGHAFGHHAKMSDRIKVIQTLQQTQKNIPSAILAVYHLAAKDRQVSMLYVATLRINKERIEMEKLLLVDHKSWCPTACVASDQCSTVGHQCCLMTVVATVVTKWMQQCLFD